MGKLWVLFLVAPIIFLGCASGSLNTATVQQAVIQFDDSNAQATIDAATQIMKHWEMNSAFWRIQFGGKLSADEFYKLRMSMNALDALKKEIGDKKLTERQAGEIIAWFGKFVEAGGNALLDEWIPKILALIKQLK
jgi:hypothetical protein